ncbi:hypothetical protein AAVH_23262 [Aphelenchoides avenae]|nr:hypothetical protein AAVH_23262 [Aphelenchus avenae]
MRLIQVLLSLVVWARISVYAADGTCKCPDSGKQEGFFTDTPCNECPTGRYRPCSRGSAVAYHNTTCLYASKKTYTQAAARMMCADSDGGGFLAFATSPDESKHIADYVRNELKQGVEDNGTYYWLGGKHKYIERTNQTFWLFEYRGYYADIPVGLLPTDINEAIAEGRTCLAGHTMLNKTLHARPCNEQLPAVCYIYRNVATHFCRQDFDKDWTLFQGKCYYAYSAPNKGNKETYRTYFDAQAECKEMGAVLATVTDEVTFKKALDLATGLETILTPGDASWIGLQLSAKGNGGIYYNVTDGTSRTYAEGQTEGWWEDGTPYKATALKSFWAIGQPDEEPLVENGDEEEIEWSCNHFAQTNTLPRDYNRDRCYADQFQHCAQVLPSGSLDDCPACNSSLVGKWSDYWCYLRKRGYICQRDPKPNPAYYAMEGRCVPGDPSSALLRL